MKRIIIFLSAVLISAASIAQNTESQNLTLINIVRNNTLSPAKVANALDALNYSKMGIGVPFTASGTNTYVSSVNAAITSYDAAPMVVIKFTNGNSGASTINLNSLGAKTILKQGSALVSGDIKPGGMYILVYDGTNFQLIGDGDSGGGGSFSAITGDPRDNSQLAGYLDAKGDATITYSAETGAHTLDAADLAIVNAGGRLEIQGDNTGALTIPLNSSVAFPVGSGFSASGFTGSVIATGGVTITGTRGDLTFPSGASIYLEKTATDTWTLNNGLPTGSTSVSGTTKLYTSTGTNTDGAMDQNSTKTALDGKQTLDSDLTTIAGLTATTDNFIVAVASAWASRTPAQVKTTLSLNNVDNISDASKPVSTAQQTAIDAKVANAINNGTTTIAPAQDAVFDALALKEDLSNKATGFGTLNNTLYPTVQAVATYVSTQTNGGYSDVAIVNQYAGVDPTGVADSKTGLQAAMASGKKVIVFDGLYKTTDLLTLNTGQTVFLRGGTVVTLSGNVNTGNCLFLMADKSNILAESGARLTHVPTGTASYTGIRASSKYLWSIDGKLTIDGFGNQGIWVQGAGSGNNQYKNGFIRGVICQSNINNGFGGTYGAGHGIKIDAGAEYVYILDVECYENQGYGVLNLGGANNPMSNIKCMKNTLGGIRINGDYTNNTDHYHVNGQFNHNDAVGTYNVYVDGVDTGVNFTGCSIFGGDSFKVTNSRGVTFNGCGISAGANNYVEPGVDGDGVVYINGGHILGNSQESMRSALRGGGMVVFNNVRETQYPSTPYSSDYSAGGNSWSDNGTTLTGNIDAISDGNTTHSNTLRIAGDGNNSTHFVSRATTLTVGTKYKIVVTVYIPSANTNVDGIRLTDSGTLSEDFSYLTTGKWVTVEKDFTATGTTLQISLLDGGTTTFTDPITDYAYIARIKLFTR
jgi:hypothetical protein